MMIFLLLAVVSATCGGIQAGLSPPPYIQSHREILVTKKAIEENIFSMGEHIPLLNDSRRHYAEIIHVIYRVASIHSNSCVIVPYMETYLECVDDSAPEAISNVRKVVDTAKKFSADLDASTASIKNLIKIIPPLGFPDRVTNLLMDVIIQSDPKKYKEEAKIYLKTGESAKIFNSKKDTFDKVSKELDAHKYVIQGSAELEKVILSLVDVIRYVQPFHPKC